MLQEQAPGNNPANYPALGQPLDELALAEIKGAILAKVRLAIGKDAGMARGRDWFMAAALAVRDRIVDRWLDATRTAYEKGEKQVYYLSLEFLVGRLLRDNVSNLGLVDCCARRWRARRRTTTRSQGGARCGARQWRPRSAGRLLHGEPGEPRHPGLRLRHPL